MFFNLFVSKILVFYCNNLEKKVKKPLSKFDLDNLDKIENNISKYGYFFTHNRKKKLFHDGIKEIKNLTDIHTINSLESTIINHSKNSHSEDHFSCSFKQTDKLNLQPQIQNNQNFNSKIHDETNFNLQITQNPKNFQNKHQSKTKFANKTHIFLLDKSESSNSSLNHNFSSTWHHESRTSQTLLPRKYSEPFLNQAHRKSDTLFEFKLFNQSKNRKQSQMNIPDADLPQSTNYDPSRPEFSQISTVKYRKLSFNNYIYNVHDGKYHQSSFIDNSSSYFNNKSNNNIAEFKHKDSRYRPY